MTNTNQKFNDSFFIPTIHINNFLEAIEKLNRKAKKLGFAQIVVTPHDEFGKEKYRRTTRYAGEGEEVTREYKVTTQKFSVVGQTPQVSGWVFLAALDHTENGNIISKLNSEVEIPEEYSYCSNSCDHCGHNRNRKKTYLIKKGETLKQVGSTCLEDFLGKDGLAQAVCAAEQLWDYQTIKTHMSDFDSYWNGTPSVESGIPIEEYLATVVALIEENGWVSRKKAGESFGLTSTSDQAWQLIMKKESKVNESHILIAEKAIEWAVNMPTKSEYERNIQIIAKNGAVRWNDAGFAASIITAYQGHCDRVRAAHNSATKPSEFQGKVGEKIEFTATLLKSLVFDSFYGRTNMLILQDDAGNIYKWSTGSFVNTVTGQKYSVKATVKDHVVYQGQNQTVLNRATLK
jgi:hypothetical protein